MNAKKAKQIRRTLREQMGGDPRDRAYAGIRQRSRGGYEVHQAVAVDCGRATYKQLKRLASPA